MPSSTHRPILRRWPWSVTALLLAACADGPPGTVDRARTEAGSLSGVYAGTFPCANCSGIDVRLWLLDGGIFFLRQDYVVPGDERVERVHARGTWAWNADDGTVALDGHGPPRRFERVHGSGLRLRTTAAGAHVVERLAGAEPFTDGIVWEGEFTSEAGVGSFLDCTTGLRLIVANDVRGRELRRRHRAISSSERSALVTVRARMTADQPQPVAAALVLDEVIAVRPASRCSARSGKP